MFHRHTSLNAIRVFEAAARLHSFKEAALELNVSATAVSHQIRGLEEKLGTQLFVRKTRSVTLTPEGEKLANSAHAALLQISATLEEITDGSATLNLCTTESFAAMWLVPRLESFSQKHGQIAINMKTGDISLDVVKDRRVDIAIGYFPQTNTSTGGIVLSDERLGLYASPHYMTQIEAADKVRIVRTAQQSDCAVNAPKTFMGKKVELMCVEKEHHALQLAITGQALATISAFLASYYVHSGLIIGSLQEDTEVGGEYRLLIPPANENLCKVRLFNSWLSEELGIEL